MMKRILRIVLVVVFMLLALGTMFYFTQKNTAAKYQKEIDVLSDALKKKPDVEYVEKETIIEKQVIISGATIEAGLRDIGKLVTAEYYFTHVSSFDSSKDLYGITIPFTQSKFIFSYDGTVFAGIDFTAITVEKDDEAKLVTITIPRSEVISAEVDTDSFKLYDEQSSIFNPIKVEDVTDSYANLIEDEKNKAIGAGLLLRANDNALQLIQNFMKGSYNLEDYEIQINFK